MNSCKSNPFQLLSAGLLTLVLAPCALSQEAIDPTTQDPQASSIPPSRFVSPEEMPEFVSMMASRFSMANRGNDPFGQVQDPTAPPKVVKKPTLNNRRPTAFKKTKFSEIISRIEVNTIMPSKNRFLIGTRPFRLGDTFPIAFRGRKIAVEVVAVNATKIDFKNTESGEIASVKLSMMPPGMKPGNDGVTAPGMVIEDKNAPLQIDSSSGF